MRIGFENSGFELNGRRYTTEGAFREAGVPKVRIGVFERLESGDYGRIATVHIRRGINQQAMKPETIERRVDAALGRTVTIDLDW